MGWKQMRRIPSNCQFMLFWCHCSAHWPVWGRWCAAPACTCRQAGCPGWWGGWGSCPWIWWAVGAARPSLGGTAAPVAPETRVDIEKKNQGTNENHLGAIFRNFSNFIFRHLFLDFSFLDQNPLPKRSFYFWNFNKGLIFDRKGSDSSSYRG